MGEGGRSSHTPSTKPSQREMPLKCQKHAQLNLGYRGCRALPLASCFSGYDRSVTVQARELQSKYEKQMKILRDDLELRRKQDLQETEERKNAHIRELMRKHRQAFNEIKNYYNDITSNNLDLIKTLKEDVAEMKKKEALNEKLMYEISTENKRLSEPLNRALKVRLCGTVPMTASKMTCIALA